MMSRKRSSSTVDRKYQFQSMMRKYENSVCHIAWTRTGQDAAKRSDALFNTYAGLLMRSAFVCSAASSI